MQSGTLLQQLGKIKIFWAHQLINTHHKSLHVVFTGSFQWMNYMYTLWLWSTNFPKSFRPIQKPWIQKSDTTEFQNLKYRHSLGVLAHMVENTSSMSVTSPRAASDSSLGTLDMHSSHAFWRLYTLKSKTVIMEKIKHEVLSVSKSVVW